MSRIEELEGALREIMMLARDPEAVRSTADYALQGKLAGYGTPDEADVGGNRPYDYLEFDFDRAEKELEEIKTYDKLGVEHIVMLRHQFKQLNVRPDVVDRAGRLQLLRCLKIHLENRDFWHKQADMYKSLLRDIIPLAKRLNDHAALMNQFSDSLDEALKQAETFVK